MAASSGPVDSAQGPWTLAEDIRLKSWLLVIIPILKPDIRHTEDGTNRKYQGTQGLSVHRGRGVWYQHGTKVTGSAIQLLELPEITGWSHATTVAWARVFLATHAGLGPSPAEDQDGDAPGAAAEAAEAKARDVLERCVPIEGTTGARYLVGRGLVGPHPGQVRWVEDARIGEGAVVIPLQAHGATVAVHLVYVDAEGNKSLIKPNKRTYRLQHDQRQGGVFEYAPAQITGDKQDPLPVLVAEGPEDFLTLVAVFPDHRVLGVPGVDWLAHMPVTKDMKLVLFKDGDPPDSSGAKNLLLGTDALLLTGAEVLLTKTEIGEDCNSILQKHGPDALRALKDNTEPAELTVRGAAMKLVRMDAAERDKERREVKKEYGVSMSTLRELEKEAARKDKPVPKPEPPAAIARLAAAAPDPWPDEVTLSAVLDSLYERLRAHVRCAPAQGVTAALWAAHTHVYELFEHSPRLGLRSPLPRCGKSTLLGILALVCRGAVTSESLSPATLVRLHGWVGHVTVLFDEVDAALDLSPELNTVLRAGFQRGAKYIRTRMLPNGDSIPDVFDVYLAVALARIGTIHNAALADRCLSLYLTRKLPGDAVARLRHDNNREKLLAIQRQLARWAQDAGASLTPDPAIPPEMDDRQADFCTPLLSIAEAAGGPWPERARQALLGVLTGHDQWDKSIELTLLRDLKAIFDEHLASNPIEPIGKQEISSAELVGALLRIEGGPWREITQGKPLSQHKLARLLEPFEIAPGKVGPSHARKNGYTRGQFTRTWKAYLSIFPRAPPFQSGQSGHPEETVGIQPDFSGDVAPPDGDHEIDRKPAENLRMSTLPTLEGGAPGENTKIPPSDPPADHPTPTATPAAPAAEPGTRVFTDGAGKTVAAEDVWVARVRHRCAEHPEWTLARLAKDMHQPVDRVRRALGLDDSRLSGGETEALP